MPRPRGPEALRISATLVENDYEYIPEHPLAPELLDRLVLGYINRHPTATSDEIVSQLLRTGLLFDNELNEDDINNYFAMLCKSHPSPTTVRTLMSARHRVAKYSGLNPDQGGSEFVIYDHFSQYLFELATALTSLDHFYLDDLRKYICPEQPYVGLNVDVDMLNITLDRLGSIKRDRPSPEIARQRARDIAEDWLEKFNRPKMPISLTENIRLLIWSYTNFDGTRFNPIVGGIDYRNYANQALMQAGHEYGSHFIALWTNSAIRTTRGDGDFRNTLTARIMTKNLRQFNESQKLYRY